jgi:hypothetical protein
MCAAGVGDDYICLHIDFTSCNRIHFNRTEGKSDSIILRNCTRVLFTIDCFGIKSKNDKSSGFYFRQKMDSIASSGSVLP